MREKLIKVLQSVYYLGGLEELLADKLIANDVVPVVRCKDCKHWIHMEDGYGDCTNGRFHLDGQVDPTMKMNDFCSCGERKEQCQG